jgi:hypothetical protein
LQSEGCAAEAALLQPPQPRTANEKAAISEKQASNHSTGTLTNRETAPAAKSAAAAHEEDTRELTWWAATANMTEAGAARAPRNIW